jgi:hypothetical protein
MKSILFILMMVLTSCVTSAYTGIRPARTPVNIYYPNYYNWDYFGPRYYNDYWRYNNYDHFNNFNNNSGNLHQKDGTNVQVRPVHRPETITPTTPPRIYNPERRPESPTSSRIYDPNKGSNADIKPPRR